MKLRSDYKDEFVKKHGVKLGLMSCFVKVMSNVMHRLTIADFIQLCWFRLAFSQAAVSGLQNQPIVNAVIDGDDIIYRDYVDVSVAVGASKVLG